MQAETMLNVRLPSELAAKLKALAQATGRTKSAITVAALQDHLEVEAWQIAEIKAGISEADRGEFVSDDEVNAFFARHGG